MSNSGNIQELFASWLAQIATKNFISPTDFCIQNGHSGSRDDLLAHIQQAAKVTSSSGQPKSTDPSLIQTLDTHDVGEKSTCPIEPNKESGNEGGYASTELHRNSLEGATELFSNLSTSSQSAVLPQFDGLKIERMLGRGGMGVVYLGFDSQLKRKVAVKMIHAHRVDAQTVNRLIVEAQSTAQVQHQNIVNIYRIGQSGGSPYFVLEYVEGGTLSSMWKREPQAPSVAANAVKTLAAAMEHAHRRGIVHRDLKPQNILVSATGDLKITDFGLAKLSNSQMTEDGQVLGTPAYMAPEQATESSSAGSSADVYSLGVILYEALTGRTPFTAPSTLELLDQLKNQLPIAVRELQPTVPKDLETICMKCLEKSPSARYASAADLADDLDRFLQQRPISAVAPTAWDRFLKFSRRNKPLVFGIVATITALSLGTIGTSIGMYRAVVKEAAAKTQSDRADRENRKSKNSLQLFLASFRNVDPDMAGADVKVVDILDPAAEMTLGGTQGDPTSQKENADAFDLSDGETRQSFASVLGSAYESLGLYEKALPLRQLSFDLMVDAELPALSVALEATQLADIYRELAENEKAIGLLEQWVLKAKAESSADTLELLIVEARLARLLRESPRRDESDIRFQDIKERASRIVPPDHSFLQILSVNSLDNTEAASDDQVAQLREMVRQLEESGDTTSMHGMTLRANYGMVLIGSGFSKEGERVCASVVEDAVAKLGAEHSATIDFQANLAGYYMSVERFDDCLKIHDQLLNAHRKRFGDENPRVVESLVVSGAALIGLQRFPEAEERLRASLSGAEACIAAGIFPPQYLLPTHSHFGAALMGNNKLEEAKDYLFNSYHQIKREIDDIPVFFMPHLPTMAERCAVYFEKTGDSEKASTYRQESKEWKQKVESGKR